LRQNVCCFDFDELNETEQNPLDKIVQTVCDKVNNMMKSSNDGCLGDLCVETGIKRVIEMNKTLEEIKHLPFSYIDDFYEIHGSHRERPLQ
jgi:hypothetical protein